MVLPVLWALLAVLALVLSWVTAAAAFAWVGCLMIASWLIGLAAARLSQRGLTAARELSADRIPFGGEVTAEVTVKNRSRLPILWLAASEALPAGLPMTGLRGRLGPLSGRGTFSFRYTLHGARRGYYQLGPTLLRTGDLFGLARHKPTPDRIAFGPNVLALVIEPCAVPVDDDGERHAVEPGDDAAVKFGCPAIDSHRVTLGWIAYRDYSLVK